MVTYQKSKHTKKPDKSFIYLVFRYFLKCFYSLSNNALWMIPATIAPAIGATQNNQD